MIILDSEIRHYDIYQACNHDDAVKYVEPGANEIAFYSNGYQLDYHLKREDHSENYIDLLQNHDLCPVNRVPIQS